MNTRQALLAAASEVIADSGWHAASSRTVAARAGVPLGAITYHFGGKDALLREAALGELHSMFATPWQIMETSTELAELVHRMLDWSHSADVTARQQAVLLELMVRARHDPETAAGLGAGLAAYRAQLVAALARVGRRGNDEVPAAAAQAFAAQCTGTFLHFMIDPTYPTGPASEAAGHAWITALRA
ncbi:TetR/AcrR family transcriptional regulator [Micromonospora chersina]